MSRPQVRAALIDLLDRENHADISKETGFDPNAYHEDRAEYIAQLADTVDALIDWKNTNQLCILVHSPFNEDSEYAVKLALAGRPILPCLLQMTKSRNAFERIPSVDVLIIMRAKDRDLDQATSDEIRTITLHALRDSDEGVRVFTVAALREFGGVDIIPALQRLAETDPAPEVRGDSVRKLAIEAIADIQKRAGATGSR
jgi:hypothetical protein